MRLPVNDAVFSITANYSIPAILRLYNKITNTGRMSKNNSRKSYVIKSKSVNGENPIHLYCFHYDNGVVEIVKRVFVPFGKLKHHKLIRKFKNKYVFESKPAMFQEYHLFTILKNSPQNTKTR